MSSRTQGFYRAADGSMRPSWRAGSSQSGASRTGSVAQASLATANQGSSKLYRYTCCAVGVAAYVTSVALAFYVGFQAGYGEGFQVGGTYGVKEMAECLHNTKPSIWGQ